MISASPRRPSLSKAAAVRAVTKKRVSRRPKSFLDRLKIFTLDGYDVRAQVANSSATHLKPGDYYHLRDEIGDGAFRRLARRCELELLYRVARADSSGATLRGCARHWFTACRRSGSSRARANSPSSETARAAPDGTPSHRDGPVALAALRQNPRAVYEMQLDGRVRTLEEATEAARKLIRRAMRAWVKQVSTAEQG